MRTMLKVPSGVLITLLLCLGMVSVTAIQVHAARRSAPPPKYRTCTSGWVSDGFSITHQSDISADAPERSLNDTNGTLSYTVTINASLTVPLTVTGGLESEAGTLIAKARTTLGVSLQTSVTISRSESRTLTVQPRSHVSFGEYIHQDTILFHHYYRLNNCSVGTDDGWRTLQGPEYKFWWARNI